MTRPPHSWSGSGRGRLQADARLVAEDLEVQVGVPADRQEALEAVDDRTEAQARLGHDSLSQGLTAEDEGAVDRGARGAVGSLAETGVLNEAHALELSEL